jgi:hypothetical protein
VHRAAIPQHVTLRVFSRSLRSQFVFPTVRGSIDSANRRNRGRFQIVHFSVQSNHVHLLVEAQSHRALVEGIRGFNVSLARRINRLLFAAAGCSPNAGTATRSRHPAPCAALSSTCSRTRGSMAKPSARSILCLQRRTSAAPASSRTELPPDVTLTSSRRSHVREHSPCQSQARGCSASAGSGTR